MLSLTCIKNWLILKIDKEVLYRFSVNISNEFNIALEAFAKKEKPDFKGD